jgi:hypothetical protein
MIANALALEHGYTITSQAVSDYARAAQVARKPCFGHSTVSSGYEGRVTIKSNSPTNAVDREHQRLAIFEIERLTNHRFGARSHRGGMAAGGAILLALRCLGSDQRERLNVRFTP